MAHHIPVLLDDTIASLDLRPDLVVVDGTVGNGGHSSRIAPLISGGILVGIDQDTTALDVARETLSPFSNVQTFFIHGNSRDIATLVPEVIKQDHVDRILLDVGLRSDQIDNAERGFSFQNDGPLDMRMDQTGDLTAADIVNTWREELIADLIFAYGDERASRRIAAALVARRAIAPFERTSDLAQVIKDSVRSFGKTHPATKTFQALRIAVNDELGALREALNGSWDLLRIGGRLAVISFHSGEDAMVKSFMREKSDEGFGELITKRPIVASPEELRTNPRARSARLRVIIKSA
jgi:16S rRNA (cytosine1402-N4)-methyltransferase